MFKFIMWLLIVVALFGFVCRYEELSLGGVFMRPADGCGTSRTVVHVSKNKVIWFLWESARPLHLWVNPYFQERLEQQSE